jgi:chromosome segregation ATPase
MSFNMDLYSIDKVEVEHADVKTFLRVLFEGYLLGTCWTYAEAYDIMEAHAQRNPILSAEELSQEILYEREIVHLEAENAELRSKVKDLEQSTLSAQSRMSAAEVKVDDLKKQLSLSRDGQQVYAQRLTEKVSDYKAIVDKVNILWKERYDS